jgi:maleate isomerase
MIHRARIGAVYPNDVWVDRDARRLVNDFRAFLPIGVDLESAGTHCGIGTASVETGIRLAENGEIEEAAKQLMRYRPDCIAYFCTTVSFVRGLGGDQDISRRVTLATGLPATTTSTGMVAALRAIGARRIAVASPYMPDVEERFINFLESSGFEVLRSVALHLPEGHSIVPIPKIREATIACDHPDAEAIFVGCTGQRLAGELVRLETRLKKTVLSANQVTVWHALQILDISNVMSLTDRGSLFNHRLIQTREAMRDTAH